MSGAKTLYYSQDSYLASLERSEGGLMRSTNGEDDSPTMDKVFRSTSDVRILFGRNRRNRLGMYAESLAEKETIKAFYEECLYF